MSLQKKFGVKVQIEFSAPHHIRGDEDECSRPHGHNFKVEVEATTLERNEIGLSFDFKHLKKMELKRVMIWENDRSAASYGYC